MKQSSTSWQAAALLAIGTTIAIYAPFIDSKLVFDDHNIFFTTYLYDAATTPFSLSPRSFPYFTFGFIEITTGSIAAQRAFNLFLHITNFLALWTLAYRLAESVLGTEKKNALLASLSAAFIFSIHPVATYATGYLIQRTILFSTLFSILSLQAFWTSLRHNSSKYALLAAALYSLAIFSKEHAIMIPAVASCLIPLSNRTLRESARPWLVFTVACLPAACLVLLSTKGIIGSSYEPGIELFSSATRTPFPESSEMQWLASANIQSGNYFQYIKHWLIPNTSTMSADIRIDYDQAWSQPAITLRPIAFILFGLISFGLLIHQSRIRLIGFGLLGTWLLFATEFSSIRFQEPFVLYRSYLWAPALAIGFSGIISLLRARWLLLFIALAAPMLAISSVNRLASLQDDMHLWRDAAEKLQSEKTYGAERIFYNLGVEYIKSRQPRTAIEYFSKSISANPEIPQSYLQRASAYALIKSYELAVKDYNRSIELDEDNGLSYFGRGKTLEALGCISEAKRNYEISLSLNILIAKLAIESLPLKYNQACRLPENLQDVSDF